MNKEKLNSIIFGTDTPIGRKFDITLLIIILVSVAFVMLESIPSLDSSYGSFFHVAEIAFTIFFTLEYLVRIYISPKPLKYIWSFWGIIDLLSILPTYVGIFYNGYRFLRAIRILRLLRAFKVLNLNQFTGEGAKLGDAIMASKNKIIVFFSFILTVVCVLGTIMYVVEGTDHGFTSIPESIYWAIVTVTTVGYGDIAPETVLGKFIASFSMIIGYAIIAIPTGIVSSELHKEKGKIQCSQCRSKVLISDNFCYNCGEKNIVS